MSRIPQAMVVLASEQLWPNIHGLVHWHQFEGGLSDLCIYHTEDESRSARLAARLKQLCESLYPGQISVHLHQSVGTPTPQSFRQQFAAWRKKLPGRHWIINATGGLKPMSAGAFECARFPDTQVVYRELSGEWFTIRLSEEGFVAEPYSISAFPPPKPMRFPFLFFSKHNGEFRRKPPSKPGNPHNRSR